jgi:ATP-dependent exoDNAse (exonuclease V) beta subunit
VPLVRTSVDEPTAELEEETRLFFVSMTRAKRNLRLLHTAWHVTHGYDQRRRNRPSRFLENVLTSGHAMQIDDAKKQRDVFGDKGAGYSTRSTDMDGGGDAPPGTRWQTKVGEKGVSLHSALDGYNNSNSSTDAGRTYMATNSNTRKHAGERKDDPLDAVSSREGSKSSNQSGMPEKLTPLQQRMRRRLGRRP